MPERVTYGFSKYNKWWNASKMEFTTVSRATYYTKAEASALKEEMSKLHNATMKLIPLSELHDELEIRAELLASKVSD